MMIDNKATSPPSTAVAQDADDPQMSTTSTSPSSDDNTKRNSIKTMKLYCDIERIDRELESLDISPSSPLTIDILSQIDSMHYGGNGAIQNCIDQLRLGPSKRVLDLGSGLGGPTRYLAKAVGCRVTALELQQDLHEKAVQLTQRCTDVDASLIRHLCGNFLEMDTSLLCDGAKMAQPPTPSPGFFSCCATRRPQQNPGRERYGVVVSWLALLHIPEKDALFSKCAKVLTGGGSLYFEDFYVLDGKRLTQAEKRTLQKDVYCENLPTRKEYIASLQQAGFGDVDFVDVTEEFKKVVKQRLRDFRANEERFKEVHSEATYKTLLHFYYSMAVLFNGGSLGGVRCHAKKG